MNKDKLNPLKIILWNKDKTKKLVDFSCISEMLRDQLCDKENDFEINENCFENNNLPNDNSEKQSKELFKANIKVFRSAKGEISLKFFFKTRNSSKVMIKELNLGEHLKWEGGKNDLKFNLKMNQKCSNFNWTPNISNEEKNILPRTLLGKRDFLNLKEIKSSKFYDYFSEKPV
jgi:hypothetical protein